MSTPPLLPNEIARRRADGLEYRPDPMRVRIELSDLLSRDGHSVRCTFEFSVRVAESRTDQQMLTEILLADRQALHRDEVAEYFTRQSRAGAEAFAAGSNAANLITGTTHEDFLAAMHRAIDASAFACGLIVMPPYRLDVDSPSLHRARQEQMDRSRAEARTSEQIEHLRRAGELVKQFQSLRESGSSVAPGKILEQISPADRGATLEAMLLASARSASPSTLWTVAGAQIAKIDLFGNSPRLALREISGALGPFRSVQPATIDDKAMLLIGAQNGVLLVDPQSPSNVRLFRVTEGASSNGFNRAIFESSTRTIWATHKEFGLRAWNIDTEEPIATAVNTSGAKNLQRVSPALIAWSVGSDVMIEEIGRDRRTVSANSSSAVAALLIDGSRCVAVHEDGTIAFTDPHTGDRTIASRRAGPICAAAALPWLGSMRLLLSRDDGAIECIGLDDQLVTQYVSAHRGARMLAASADIVAAVSTDRQRIIFWHAWDGRAPFAEIHVTSQMRHRIADIDFA